VSGRDRGVVNDFGCIADVYDQLVEWAPYEHWTSQLEPRLTKHGLARDACILDAACGTGLSMLPWLERGYRVVGTDASPQMLARCRRRLAGSGHSVELLEQDLLNLDVDGRFDLALCTHSGLDYILDDADLERAFHSLRGCMAEGGLFAFDKCLDEPGFYKEDYSDSRELDGASVQFQYRWDRSRRILEQRCIVYRTKGEPARTEAVFHLRAVAPDVLIEMLDRAGFEVLEPPRQFTIRDPGTGIFRAV
jgi:SAM-dependent methyltransferase